MKKKSKKHLVIYATQFLLNISATMLIYTGCFFLAGEPKLPQNL